ncbi:MAG TPA: hypothetical protein VGJ01_09225 [Pseudolabrys sp.]|jgi:hypothetical protein
MVDRWCYPVPQAMQRHTGSHLPQPPAAREPSPPTVPVVMPAPETAPSLAPNDTDVMPGAAAR